MKINTSLDDLCRGCPRELKQFVKYVASIKFTENPDYELMKKMVRQMADDANIDLYDGMYDWCVKAVMITEYS